MTKKNNEEPFKVPFLKENKMLFSSISFYIIFLPALIIIYFITPKKNIKYYFINCIFIILSLRRT